MATVIVFRVAASRETVGAYDESRHYPYTWSTDTTPEDDNWGMTTY